VFPKEAEDLSRSAQTAIIGSQPKSVQYSSHPHNLFLQQQFYLCPSIHLYFLSGFPTKSSVHFVFMNAYCMSCQSEDLHLTRGENKLYNILFPRLKYDSYPCRTAVIGQRYSFIEVLYHSLGLVVFYYLFLFCFYC
jgi:hypothetical protein